jgi:hypothetical protein
MGINFLPLPSNFLLLQLFWWLVCIGRMAETHMELTRKHSLSSDWNLSFQDRILYV